MTGNKKYNLSKLSPDSERLLTSFGINLSTEFSVLLSTNLQLKSDSWNKYSGFIKLLNSKLEFFESPWQLARRTIQIRAIKSFNLDLIYLNNEIIIL